MALVEVTCADGRQLAALSKLIEQRSKWLNETAEQACAACMIDVLVSLRAVTKVAKPSKNEIVLSDTSLKPSITGGKKSPVFCLRIGKSRYTPQKNERIARTTNDLKDCSVFKWHDIKQRIWLIVAKSRKDAMNWALGKLKKRANQYKGLARTALSLLMKQSGSKTSPSITNTQANQKASTLTKVVKTGNGSTYSISASDMLDYAKLALKGGNSSINEALGKASNKIASVINQKCKNLLMFEKIEPPFPELRSRK